MLPDQPVRAVDQRVCSLLSEEPGISVRFDLQGRDITTFAIGGPLRALAEVHSIAALQKLLVILKDEQCEYTIVGAGSNLLIDDSGIDRWIIRLGSGFKTIAIEDLPEQDSVKVTVGGAVSLMAFSRDMCGRGYAGLAFAGGIPASLGGAVRMNAGAHGGEMREVVEQVDVLGADGQLRQLSNSQMNFSYRHSVIGASDIVVGARLSLKRRPVEEVQAQRAHCLEERRSRQPLSQPSAGSVFKNPAPDRSAGMLIERAGLKGQRIGAVEISSRHANWIVNPLKQGRAEEVRALITLCQERVQSEFGEHLHPEIITLF